MAEDYKNKLTLSIGNIHPPVKLLHVVKDRKTVYYLKSNMS